MWSDLEITLNILVWGVPELSSQVTVRSDRKITIPFLGDVSAVGLKISSLRKFLAGEEKGKENLAKYVKDPKITITLLKSSGKIQITMSGVLSQMGEVPRQTTGYANAGTDHSPDSSYILLRIYGR